MADFSTSIEIEDIYELSPMQVGMLFQTLLAPASGVFVEQQVMRLPGTINQACFQRAWQDVIDRTPVLRSSFHWGDLERPVQIVHRRVPIQIDQLDWRHISRADRDNHLAQYLRSERLQGFELDRPPLLRLALIRSSTTESWFVWHFHHLLLDGWSGQLLLQELVEQYQALASGQEYVPPKRPPFSDYIGWLQSQDDVKAEEYWRTTLRGFSRPTPIGIGRMTVCEPCEGNDGKYATVLSIEQSELLRKFAKTHRITLNTVIQGAWALLIARYSGESDIVHGVVVSGRPPELPGVDEMIGLFINTLPVRVEVSPDQTVSNWLKRLQARQMDMARYQYVSGLQIQRWSEIPSGTRLFDTVVVFENFPTANRGASAATADEPIYLGRTDVAITVVVVPGNQIRIKLLYDHRRFAERDIEQIARSLTQVIRDFATNPHTALRDISLLSSAERRQITIEWNATTSEGYDAVPLMELLARQAEETPDAIAFIEGANRVSLAAVHESSNRLANYLASLGVRAGTVVGVCRERSLEAVIAFLAVLKLRAVFLPLDPSYPRQRLAYMIRDSNTAVALGCDPSLAGGARVLDWNDTWQSASRFRDDSPVSYASPEDLAYIIYTSGSTGRPKGVAVPHRVLLNRLTWMWREYPFAPDEVGIMKTPLNFVDAFWEMLGGLLRGFPTVIAPQQVVSDPQAFVDLLATHAVTRLWFVPSFLELLLENVPDIGRRLPALRFWSSGGEPLSVDLYRRFQRAVPHAVLYNVFGASELWDATVFDPERDGPVDDCVPIGRPIANTRAFILDAHAQPVPIGVAGTLHIGGAPVARGYVNLDELSRQRFHPDRFSNQPGARLYDTGDLARYRSEGVIEYLGRRDLQLNLRGFRVEAGEIEALIDSYPAVRESIVVAQPRAGGDQRLIAYVVPRDGDRDTPKLIAHLAEWLPSFMLPTVTWIDEMPMTPSGKRDRAQLSDSSLQTIRDPVAPSRISPLERLVAQHFCAVLGIDNVGATDDFFAHLGGHSLLATRLLARLRESTGLDIPLRTIFDAPTPAMLAAAIERISGNKPLDAESESILAEMAELPVDESNALLQSLQAQTEGDEL